MRQNSRQNLRHIFTLLTTALLSLPVMAESLTADCALARDPARCELRQTAIKDCADTRGSATKQACIEARMPPVDCATASDPQRCEAIARAKEICRDKTGKEQKACLKGEGPKKKATKKKKAKTTGKKRPPTSAKK